MTESGTSQGSRRKERDCSHGGLRQCSQCTRQVLTAASTLSPPLARGSVRFMHRPALFLHAPRESAKNTNGIQGEERHKRGSVA